MPIQERSAVFGEVGLAGEIRAVSQSALGSARRPPWGSRRCIVPAGNCAPSDVPPGVELVGVKTVAEALDQLIAW